LAFELEIINISPEFVADFCVSQKKKMLVGHWGKTVLIFSGEIRRAGSVQREILPFAGRTAPVRMTTVGR
jgi:hypothetical protein